MKNKMNDSIAILAGGKSTRAEMLKGLRDYKGQFWIDFVIESYLNMGFKNVYVGLGFFKERYLESSTFINHPNVFFIINSRPENGPFSTFQEIIKQSDLNDIDFMYLTHIDRPVMTIKHLDILSSILTYDIVKPTFNEKSGHPIKLKQSFCKFLLDYDASLSLKFILAKYDKNKIKWVSIDDSLMHLNLNTESEWKLYLEKYS